MLPSFLHKQFESKPQARAAVALYHNHISKNFNILRSEKKRLYFSCPDSTCNFRINYNLNSLSKFEVKNFSEHSCSNVSENLINSSFTPKVIANLPSVLNAIEKNFDKPLSTTAITNILNDQNIFPSKNSIRKALTSAQKIILPSEKKQYTLLPDYITKLNEIGHFAELCTEENVFKQATVIFKQGIDAFSIYSRYFFLVSFKKIIVTNITFNLFYTNTQSQLFILKTLLNCLCLDLDCNWMAPI